MASRIKADERSVAMHMLKEAWAADKLHNHVDHFHWINSAEYLSVADFTAIGRAVWE